MGGGTVSKYESAKHSTLVKRVDNLESNWEALKEWIKQNKINCTGGDRFWDGYDDFNGDVEDKIKELEARG